MYLFLGGGGEGVKEERNISVWLPLTWAPLGIWPSTQACALTGNQTGDPLVHRPAFCSLSYTSQGWKLLFNLVLSISSLCQGGAR